MAGGSQLVPALVWALVGEVGLVHLSPGELQPVAELLWVAEEAQERPLVPPQGHSELGAPAPHWPRFFLPALPLQVQVCVSCLNA